MADLDDKSTSSGDYGIVEQDDGSPEVVWSQALTTGEQYSFAFLVCSREDVGADPHHTVMYQAIFLVDVSWDADDTAWHVTSELLANTGGTAAPAWAAAMNSNTLEISADGAANWLHMAAKLGHVSCEFVTTTTIA